MVRCLCVPNVQECDATKAKYIFRPLSTKNPYSIIVCIIRNGITALAGLCATS
ncbi:MAG: hypothetical protein JWR72_2382 [Flavisolibacter sp.]|nr:hypothetical protein [Flavisolibacter sp.]